MKYYFGFILALGCGLFSCSPAQEKSVSHAATPVIYLHGDILTMEGDAPTYAEALVIQEGVIRFVGSRENALAEYGGKGTEIDLQGKTLLPGFIDGHAHFFGFGAQAVMANLLAEPDGKVNNIPQLIHELQDWYEKNGTDKTNGWIVGMGFDDAVLAEKRFPTKADLDSVSTEIPVCIVHISGHFCVMNSVGLEQSGINAETPDPEGGIIRRMANSREPNGVLEELAAIPLLFEVISPKETELVNYYLDKAQEMAARYGYTTAQEGRAMTNHEQMAAYAGEGKLYLDVPVYIDYNFSHYMHGPWHGRDYTNHYRVAGIKLTLDGSPQGRTAWRTQPYLIPPQGMDDRYAGYPAIPEDEKVRAIIDSAFRNNWQLLTHANGDAAIDQLIRCMRPAIEKYGNADRRDVLIHGQYIRKDQLDSLQKYGIFPSLFPMHTFYWGDWHKEIIGAELGNQISPIKSAIDKGMWVTSHTDAPVAFPNLMMVLWTTVNRISRSGEVIGPRERLTPYEALKTITHWAAYQHFEEDQKGTLSAGKLADLVILDKNPLKIDRMDLKDIQIVETIKEGKTIYLNKQL